MLRSLLLVATMGSFAAMAPQAAHAATPAPAAKTACLVRVFDLAPINSQDGVRASVWAVSLRTNDVADAMKSTGVISLVTKNERYDIPFKDFAVPKPRDEVKEVPLLVTFPRLVRLVSGYVASVAGSEGGRCNHISAFSDEEIDAHYRDSLPARTKRATVLIATKPLADPQLPDCVDDGKQAGATLDKFSAEPIPRTKKGATVELTLDLSDEAIPWDAWVSKSSGDSVVDGLALKAAVESKYAPGRYHCRPYGGRLVFPITFP